MICTDPTMTKRINEKAILSTSRPYRSRYPQACTLSLSRPGFASLNSTSIQ